jgi:hypothetical protein
LICTKGGFIDPFAVLDLVTIVLSLERGHHRTLMVVQLASRHQV